MTLDFNRLAEPVAAVVTFASGGVWYGPECSTGGGLGLVVGAGWVATSSGGVNGLFAGRPLALFAIDAGYNVVLFAL